MKLYDKVKDMPLPEMTVHFNHLEKLKRSNSGDKSLYNKIIDFREGSIYDEGLCVSLGLDYASC